MRFSDAKKHKVISTADATTVAQVDGFVVDAPAARVVALLLKKTQGDTDLLAWSDVVGFGPDAVTVAGVERLVKGSPEQTGKEADVLGRRVLTERGVELGKVDDVEFDPATGAVTGLLVKGADEVAGDRMMGLGSYALVVCEDQR